MLIYVSIVSIRRVRTRSFIHDCFSCCLAVHTDSHQDQPAQMANNIARICVKIPLIKPQTLENFSRRVLELGERVAGGCPGLLGGETFGGSVVAGCPGLLEGELFGEGVIEPADVVAVEDEVGPGAGVVGLEVCAGTPDSVGDADDIVELLLVCGGDDPVPVTGEPGTFEEGDELRDCKAIDPLLPCCDILLDSIIFRCHSGFPI